MAPHSPALFLHDNGLAQLAGVDYLCAAPVPAKDGRIAVYMIDAQRREQLYKYVIQDSAEGCPGEGVLYAACFGPAGHGRWLPLVLAPHGFSIRDGYIDAADLLARAGEAAAQAGATRIPNLFALNLRNGGGELQLCGHVSFAIAWREALADAASLTFSWSGPGAALPETPACGFVLEECARLAAA